MEHKCESAAPARPDYVGRHRLFRKVRIEGGNYGYRYVLEPVVLHGNPNYVPRHYLSPLTAALRAAREAHAERRGVSASPESMGAMAPPVY